jgi:hypothetical protein
MKKTRSKKSRDTVPLKGHGNERDIFLFIYIFQILKKFNNFQLLVQIFGIIRDFSSPLLHRLKQGTLCIFGEFKKEMFQISSQGLLRNRISSKKI